MGRTDKSAGPRSAQPFRVAAGGAPGLKDPQGLLLAAADGDRAAFGALYDVLAPRMYGLIRAVLPDAGPAADEVMHDAFVEVWRSAPGYDAARNSAPAWIFRIAYHHAARRARAMRVDTGG